MRIYNLTKYPSDEVRTLVRYGMRELTIPKGLPVYIKPNRKHFRGYARWASYGGTSIEIWLGPESIFPMSGWRRHRSSPMNHDWQNWQEALVALSAHEGRHIDLAEHSFRYNSQEVEMSCEAWEHKRLNDYRAKFAA